MSLIVISLICALVLWMLACAWCGFYRRFVMFLGVLLAGLAVNMAWMMVGLQAKPLEPHAVMAQAAAVLYAVGAFGVGWLGGRVAQQFRASQVEDAGV